MSDKKTTITTKILRELIDNRYGDSRKELIEALGCDASTITKHYNGDRQVNTDFLVRYAKHFGVSTDYLLGIEQVQTNNPDVKFIHKYTRLDEKLIAEMNNYRQYPSTIIRFLNNYCYGENKRAFTEFCSLFEAYKMFLSEYNREANRILSQDEQSISKDDFNKLDDRENIADLYAYKTEISVRELMRKYAKQEIEENEKLKAKHHALSWKLNKQTMNDIIDKQRGESNGDNQEKE